MAQGQEREGGARKRERGGGEESEEERVRGGGERKRVCVGERWGAVRVVHTVSNEMDANDVGALGL